MAHLKNWRKVYHGEYFSLAGDVYGHPNFEDSTFVVTSLVEEFDGETAKTMNTFYTLEKPKRMVEVPEWATHFAVVEDKQHDYYKDVIEQKLVKWEEIPK